MTIKSLITFLILATLFVACEDKTPSKEEENDPIITCFEEQFEKKGEDYHELLDKTVAAMNELGFPMKGGKKEDLIEVLLLMKSGSFPKDVNLESEAIYSTLRIYSLEACVLEHRLVDESTMDIIDQMELIHVYDTDNQKEFVGMIDNAVASLNSFSELPAWIEPFNLHLATLFYTQYWRLNAKKTEVDSKHAVDSAERYPNITPGNYPPPPVAPPPPPPPPREAVIEVEDDEEEIPMEFILEDSI